MDTGTRRGAIAAAGAALLLSCSGGGSHGHAPAVFHETEPNDAACCPNQLGWIGVGDHVPIAGWIIDDGSDDFDGFALVAASPMTLELRLFAHAPADLDMCVWDPYFGVWVGCFESPFDPEVGFVHVLEGGTPLHVVVSSFAGTAPYTLEVRALPLALATGGPQAAPAGALLAEPGGQGGGKEGRRVDLERYASEVRARDGIAEDAGRPRVVSTGALVLLDEEGETRTVSFAVTSEGDWAWMGTPDEARREEP